MSPRSLFLEIQPVKMYQPTLQKFSLLLHAGKPHTNQNKGSEGTARNHEGDDLGYQIHPDGFKLIRHKGKKSQTEYLTSSKRVLVFDFYESSK